MACAHCGDPVPAGLIKPEAALQFCCQGCETVYAVIQSCGLDRYYKLRESASTSAAKPTRSTGSRFAEFDDPAFSDLYVKPLDDSLRTVELFLPGAHCAACVWLVEKLPIVAPGVLEAKLDLRRALVRIVWDASATSLSTIARALDSLGYPPHPARDAAMREARRRDDRQQLIRIGIAGACAGNVMLLALALYAGMFDAIEPQYLALFRWTSMFISLVALAWPGSVFFRGAWAALRTRTLHLDLPIAIGLGAGGLWGVINTIRGVGDIYFDSLAVLVFALLVGRWIQRRQQRSTSDAVELLFSLTPSSAQRVDPDGQVREVPVQALHPGEIVEVRAGESVPVDGVIVQGQSQVDHSLLTGESQPVGIGQGQHIAAGAVNLSAPLRVRVEAAGEQTRVGKLMRMVEEASRRRAPIVLLADRIAGWFVAGMLTLAMGTLGLWLWLDASRALDHTAALLIVTCPCALGLATPLALTAAIGRGAARRFLIKGGDALEKLARPGVIFLDKTGTITQGRMALVRWLGDDRIKPLVRALEAHSSHPIAQALVRDLATSANDAETDDANASPQSVATQPRTNTPRIHESRQTTGAGIEARIDDHDTVIGSPRFVRDRCKQIAPELIDAERELSRECLTPVLIGIDGKIVAAAGLGDPIRDDARDAIGALLHAGWDVRILSGDHADVVRAVGTALGLDSTKVRGGVSPEEKLAIVRSELEREAASNRGNALRRPVVMVGDGVNDAAALAAATVGIAVHGGAEASLSAADIYINRPGLSAVVELITAARRTMNVVRRNLIISLFYNALAATLAVTGVINPLIAAILMPASSLSVVTISFRSRTFDEGGRP